jgi:spore coat polysaccharide biosynthesis predicted glycosyltransferase SpsG
MTAGPRVAFLTHGGSDIGLGHIARCLSLARALAAEGAHVVFLVGRDARVTFLVEAAGFDVVESAWETTPAATSEAVAAVRPGTLVVDSYVVTGAMLDSLRPLVSRLVAIDDIADRPLPVHTVVNGAAGAGHLEYCGGLSGTEYLLGPRYALLDPAFAAEPARRTRSSVERVLVTLGGGSHPAALRAVVQAALSLDMAAVDVVAGPLADDGEADAIEDARVVVHRGVSALRPLMLAADVAVSGAGMTLLELAATATPTAFLTLAPNESNSLAFERAGAALSAGSPRAPDLGATVTLHLKRLAGDPALRESLGTRARRLVDGRGALRVARALMAGVRR